MSKQSIELVVTEIERTLSSASDTSCQDLLDSQIVMNPIMCQALRDGDQIIDLLVDEKVTFYFVSKTAFLPILLNPICPPDRIFVINPNEVDNHGV